jgi:oligopeptide/dipeptide ABC transporter ATP-binding protein
VSAVADVNLLVHHARTVGIVGESGAGKSTLGRLLLRLIEPDRGSLSFEGTDLLALDSRSMRRLRPRLQMVFQDPYSSFDPTMTIAESVGEPLKVHTKIGRRQRHERVSELLEQVGLPHRIGDRYPREFSGGQLQRIAVARALSLHPALLVCDEPVASLDLSVQGQVLNLLLDLQEQEHLTYVFISHDLGVVERFADDVVVMYRGRVVESGSALQVCRQPSHPYSQALLGAVPVADPRLRSRRAGTAGRERVETAISGVGCPFAGRCAIAIDVCREANPPLATIAGGRLVACHRVSGSMESLRITDQTAAAASSKVNSTASERAGPALTARQISSVPAAEPPPPSST